MWNQTTKEIKCDGVIFGPDQNHDFKDRRMGHYVTVSLAKVWEATDKKQKNSVKSG